MTRKTILAAACLLAIACTHAQNGSVQISFTPETTGKPVTIQVAAPLLKFDNTHGYWFTNPHNGGRHLQYTPEQGWSDRSHTAAYITINEAKNDFDVFTGTSGDSDEISCQNMEYVITAPKYDVQAGDKNKPLHVHINSFSASECSFTISGAARLQSIQGYSWFAGTVTGGGHFYREPKYDKSDVLPGCDCDPTIYAAVYDEENNVRTASACENALKNKIFDALQKAMAPLFTNIAFNGKTGMAAGNIDIVMMPGHVDISVPVKERSYCSVDYRHNWLTGMSAHKALFNNEDSYGLRFIKIPAAAELNGGSADPVFLKKLTAFTDSAMKLIMAGKMTTAQYEKAQKDFNQRAGGEMPDYKKMEMEHNLTIQVLINPTNREMLLVKLGDKNNTKVQHTIKGAAYEIFSPQVKESDGSWIPNRWFVYAGKFENPVPGKSGGGFDAAIVKAVYPATGNKLSIYNMLIKIEGDKEMADKAMANIDFDALQKLITHQ